MTPHIAVLDDEPRMAEVLSILLRRAGFRVQSFHHPVAFLQAFEVEGFDLLLTDLKLPEMDGVAVLKEVRARDPQLPVILITAHATLRTAIEAIRQGAFDYVEKPFDNELCLRLVRRALELTKLSRENRYLRQQLRSQYALDQLIAVSPAMQRVVEMTQRAARAPSTVLISGPSGTGKELIARAIHAYSDRVGKPFVAVNCPAFASGVLESELFGHEKGAFTGADRTRRGLFEQADGGTLLLDEIGEISPDFQGKLLRVLQEREVQRVGGDQQRPVDVRVVACTNRDLQQEVAAGNFREDLYFRIAVIPIEIPPLRDRREDIIPLARHFLLQTRAEVGSRVSGWTAEAEAYLTGHDWPGNVRELENSIERAVVLTRTEQITASDLAPARLGEALPDATELTLHEHLDRAAAARIRTALSESNGVRIDAARRLGIERTTLYRLIKKFGIADA